MPDFIPHIFVVEDEELNRTIITEYFDEMPEEYVVETAEDGESAWQVLQKTPEKFDVILLDRMMPGMDGMELLSHVKAHPVLTHLPVIFQTALSSRADIAEGMKAGAHYYLTKPFEFDLLYSVVRTAVRDRKEYRRMTSELTEHYAAMSCLNNANLKFKTIEEAKKISIMLANACDNTEKVVLGLTELMINAVEHGNLEITYEEKGTLTDNGSLDDEILRRLLLEEYSSKVVDVSFVRKESSVEITIVDEGKGFDWKPFLTMSPERALDNHGRGIAMAALMSFDSLEYLGSGNTVKAIVKSDNN